MHFLPIDYVTTDVRVIMRMDQLKEFLFVECLHNVLCGLTFFFHYIIYAYVYA